MPASSKVTILIGPAGAGKRADALERYRAVLGQPGLANRRRALWLAPTQAAAAAVRDDLVRSPRDAVLDAGVMTFAQFAAAVVRDAGVPVRTISKLQRRRLLRTIIERSLAAGGLEYFGPVADSPGFLALADDWIADLQHRDVAVEVARRRAARGGQRDRELAALYAGYDAQLAAGGLIDAQGLFRAAREGMALAPQLGEGLELVVADGFTDFTKAQQEILQRLAERAEHVLVTLVGEESSPRPDLFAKTQAMARSLQRPGRAAIEFAAASPSDWPAMDHLQRNLFRGFHDLEPPTAAVRQSIDRFHVIAASSIQAEIEEIARQVKRRLLAGAAPGEVVVSFRSTSDVADRVRQAFDDHGIPTYLDAPVRLSAVPLVRSLLALVRLHAEDWPYRLLLRVAGDRALRAFDSGWHALRSAEGRGKRQVAGGTTPFEDSGRATPRTADVRAAAELCIRHAQLPKGRRALAEQLALWAAAEVEDAEPGTPQHAARAALPALKQLAHWLDELPARADVPGWVAAIERLAGHVGLSTKTPADVAAQWSLLGRGLQSAAQLDALIGAAPAELDATEFAHVLAATAADLPTPQGRDATGRVRVLSADAARHTRPRHLLVGGLSEDAFPAERRLLRTALSILDEAESEDASGRQTGTVVDDLAPSEMLLFYQLVTRPTETLTLSYPALDAKAQPLPASPLLVELERAFGEAALPRTVQSLAYAAHDDGSPLSRSELRRTAVAAAQDRRRELLAALVRSPQVGAVGASIVDGVEVVANRARREFSGFEGLCTSDAMLRTLAQKYGPEYLWSPSRLEAYAGCPFKFFGEYLLKLQPVPELALESDMARRGTLLHDTLARLYERIAAEPGGPPPTPEEVAERFAATLDAVAGARPGRGLDGALREIERRQIAAWARLFAEQHDAYSRAWDHLDEPLAAAHFEVRFGGQRRRTGVGDDEEADGGLSTDEPFELMIGEERIRFGGQIDRIDIGRVGETVVFSVIDYKTSAQARLKDADMAAGKQIQLQLYVLAVAELLLADQEAVGLSAGYWSVRGKGYHLSARSGGPLTLGEVADGAVRPTAKWLADRDALVAKIEEIVASIRSGWFPVYNDDQHCGRYCPYNTLCRIAQVRSLEKVWAPPVS